MMDSQETTPVVEEQQEVQEVVNTAPVAEAVETVAEEAKTVAEEAKAVASEETVERKQYETKKELLLQ